MGLHPVAYWKLNERTSSKIAWNLGSGAIKCSGYYSKDIELGLKGVVVDEHPSVSCGFVRESKTHVDVKFTPLVVPQDEMQHFSFEGWFKVLGSKGTTRSVVVCGRYSLLISKLDKWSFAYYHHKYRSEVILIGPEVVYNEWCKLRPSNVCNLQCLGETYYYFSLQKRPHCWHIRRYNAAHVHQWNACTFDQSGTNRERAGEGLYARTSRRGRESQIPGI